MPLSQRATNVLATLQVEGIGCRPVLFVTHSMGGLLIKKMLWNVSSSIYPNFPEILAQIKGIVFLATPHTGADLAKIVSKIGRILPIARITGNLQELARNDTGLMDLNRWYINNHSNLGIPIEVLHETQDTAFGRIVDESSSDPGLPNISIIPVDADHVSICKPRTNNDLVYKRIARFIEETLYKIPKNPL